MNINATEQEWQALITLIDAAVRNLGIRGAGTAVGWVMKIETAMKEQANGTMEIDRTTLPPGPGGALGASAAGSPNGKTAA